MITFKEYYQQIDEIVDSKKNREDLINAYGLADYSTNMSAVEDRASELLNMWTKLEPNIDPNWDYFRVPNKKYNPRDIYSWSRVAADMGYDKLEGLQSLEAMMADLRKARQRKQDDKLAKKDYDVVFKNENATVFRPKSEQASCALGANTKWCTAATQGGNKFYSYKEQGVVLFYVITKKQKYNTAQAVWPPQPASGGGRAPGSNFKEEEKYAIAMYPGGEVFEVYDAEDNSIDWDEFKAFTASELGIPTDEAFYRKHGPEMVDVLKERVNTAISYVSGSVRREDFDPETTNWELFHDVLEVVRTIYKNNDTDQIQKLKKLRKQDNKPDELFLMDVLENASMQYFLDREYNPEGSNNWSNAQFQAEIVRSIRRLKTLLSDANDDNKYNEDDFHEAEELSRKVYGPTDGDDSRNMQHGLRMYVSRHMNDRWPELEKALIELWMTCHGDTDKLIFQGKAEWVVDPYKDSMMWLRLVMDMKNGEWPELEEAIHKRIKHVLHNDPMNDSAVDGLIVLGNRYNVLANAYRGMDRFSKRSWLPASKEQLKDYADGEWDIDGPPLDPLAVRERQYQQHRQKI